MKLKHMPSVIRFWRILRMAIGLIFSQRPLWIVVEAECEYLAVDAAKVACPAFDLLTGIMVTRLPGYRNKWRVRYIY